MSWRNQQEVLKREFCEILTRIGAIKFGVFTLADGKLSPYYIDLRIITSFPEVFVKVEKLYLQVARNELNLDDVKRIGGIPTAGIPFASVLAYSLNKPFLYIRREPTSGRERRVEGLLNPGDAVLLVDDLITTGRTLIAATDAILSEGGVVKEALVLIDRNEGGSRILASKGIRLHCLIQMNEAAQILYDMGAIEKEELNAILKQITS